VADKSFERWWASGIHGWGSNQRSAAEDAWKACAKLWKEKLKKKNNRARVANGK